MRKKWKRKRAAKNAGKFSFGEGKDMMLNDIGEYLQEKDVGTLGTDLFIGYFPETPDHCIVLLETEGEAENCAAGTETPGLQVAARFTDDYGFARGKLKEAHDALKVIGNEESGGLASGIVLNGRQYFYAQPVFSGVMQLEDDSMGRKRIAKNYLITKEEE